MRATASGTNHQPNPDREKDSATRPSLNLLTNCRFATALFASTAQAGTDSFDYSRTKSTS